MPCSLSISVILLSIVVLCACQNGRTLFHRSDKTEVNMIVMGDWGGIPIYPYYSPFELACAKEMMSKAKLHNTDFVVALGDNFYYDGVTDEFDPRFQNTFEKVFSDESFLDTPWFILAGNHDHRGNITAQIAYSKRSHRWNFPQLWYNIEVQRPDMNITIVMIDTVTLCGNTLSDSDEGQPSGIFDQRLASDQLAFIEDSIKDNKNHYVLVAGHFPVWSVAEHGPTQCLVEKLKPLLEKYGVSAYFSGHDHNLQHIRESGSPVEYFVSGAVDIVNPSMKHESDIPANSLQFHWASVLGLAGFATVEATTENMVVKFHSATGATLYKYSIPPRK
ncbi:tartrate-resistant acid phosphatase type 5-like [Clavelina lepadiformis]|uniref:tartrate-resistant acid phosphatase type 5-like n=1 Tax=Clavelina lepadiformis TaxID=159417 RepID=UPI0040438736